MRKGLALGRGALVLLGWFSLSVGHAETYVLQDLDSGQEATVRIPVGAVTKVSSQFAESIADGNDLQCERLRLAGDVLISIAGREAPIEIKAERVMLELVPNAAPMAPGEMARDLEHRASAASTPLGADEVQVFSGHVVFDLATPEGHMQIKADRVEYQPQVQGQARVQAPAAKSGA